MKNISKLTILELAQLVADNLSRKNIEAVLVGGACVSIYSKNNYQSYDLDFVTESSLKEVQNALKEIGFSEKKGRIFSSPKTEYVIDFVAPPVSIGNEPIKEFFNLGKLKLLTPTDCVKDRLSAYYYWNDAQSLEQAVMVAEAQKKKVNIKELERWSKAENNTSKFQDFMEKTDFK
ncbi:MAG: hypothetical protein NT145_06980 [Elusimicrobia bacterium]|nr:hypothetical protein [Elusimicrobiota bacterium]